MSLSIQRMRSLAAMLTLALGASACATGAGSNAGHVADAGAGKVVAREFCAGCHAIAEEDASRDSLAPPFRTILAHYPADRLAADLRDSKSISYLHMPQFFFGEGREQDLVAYMKTLPADR